MALTTATISEMHSEEPKVYLPINIEEIRKIYDIVSAKEKEAAAKQTFSFLAPLTNEQSCVAGR